MYQKIFLKPLSIWILLPVLKCFSSKLFVLQKPYTIIFRDKGLRWSVIQRLKRYLLTRNNTSPSLFFFFSDKGYCEQGWELYGDSCFLFELEQGHEKNFDDARAYCQSYNGADLASIHNRLVKFTLLNLFLQITISMSFILF